MLCSVVKIQVSRVMSDHSHYHGICWLHNCVFGCSISGKKWPKIVLFMEFFTDLKSAVLEWCMLHNTFHLTFLTMHKFQSFKLIREPYLLELKIVFFLRNNFIKLCTQSWLNFSAWKPKPDKNLKYMFFHYLLNKPPKRQDQLCNYLLLCANILIDITGLFYRASQLG